MNEKEKDDKFDNLYDEIEYKHYFKLMRKFMDAFRRGCLDITVIIEKETLGQLVLTKQPETEMSLYHGDLTLQLVITCKQEDFTEDIYKMCDEIESTPEFKLPIDKEE